MTIAMLVVDTDDDVIDDNGYDDIDDPHCNPSCPYHQVIDDG